MNLFTHLVLSSLSLAAIFHATETANDGAEKKDDGLPLIWPAIRQDKSYRIIYQLQMSGSSERLSIEEWASFDKQLFRLDLIYSDVRVTYLTNGKTNEVFRYSPFICDQLDSNSKELGPIANLFKGYSLSNNQMPDGTLAFGLGPLWLRARVDASKVRPMLNTSVDYRRHEFLSHYDGYELSFDAASIPYNLRFYFQPKKDLFVEAVEWLDSSAASTNSNKNKRSDSNKVEARAKLIWTDMGPIDDSVFELPIGYGCQRKPEFEHPFQDVDMGLGLLHEGGPNQATFELTTSRPRDLKINSWASQRFTLHIMRGELRLNGLTHNYYVTRIQDRDLETSKLRRVKRVWSSVNPTSSRRLVYTIDELSGECSVDRMSIKNLIQLPFPVDQQESNVAGAATIPVPLDIQLVVGLFNYHGDQASGSVQGGFHLLREKLSYSGNQMPKAGAFRDAVYERRIEKFPLVGDDGSVLWTGPLSIVKRIKSFALFLDNEKSGALLTHYHSIVTLFFYTEDLSKILFKTVIDLAGNEELDISYMHKQLDIGGCFSEGQKEDLVIKYPLESQQWANQLFAIQDTVQDRFLMNLFGTTPLLPIQVSDVQLSSDNFYLYLKLTILDLPLTQTFEQVPGQQLVAGGKHTIGQSSAIVEKLTSSVDRCAQACEYYLCYQFSFNTYTKRCRLALREGIASYEPSATSDLYQYVKLTIDSAWAKYEPSGGRSHLRPRIVHQLLNELVASGGELPESDSSGQDAAESTSTDSPFQIYENYPLRIRIESEMLRSSLSLEAPDYFELRPEAITSDMESMNEFLRENIDNWEAASVGGENKSVVRIMGDIDQLQVQYRILFDGRQFSSDAGELHEHLSGEECAQICEDTDFRSFSYCPMSEVCIVTNLHKTKDIERLSTGSAVCSISTLDYLSKFEAFGATLPPTTAKGVHPGISEDDCATLCMEEQHFNCQGFYHCSRTNHTVDGHTETCYLQGRHIEEGDGLKERRMPRFQGEMVGLTRQMPTLECKFFSRSYLSQFNEFYGMQLRYDEASGNSGQTSANMELVVGLGAEQCAARCIQESCLAFHICVDPLEQTRGSYGSSVRCEIAKQQVKRTNLVPKKLCTTFVLSDKSQFNLKKTLLISDTPNRKALDTDNGKVENIILDEEQEKALKLDINNNMFDWFWSLDEGKFVKTSHWLAKLISLIGGLALGVCCVFLWRRKDLVYNTATQVGSYYRTRV